MINDHYGFAHHPPRQCFGKIGLLGSICTAGKFADEVRWQHEANRGAKGGKTVMGEKWDGYGWIIINFGMRIFQFFPQIWYYTIFNG